MSGGRPREIASRLRPPQPEWLLTPPPDAAAVARLMAELHLPETVCSLLAVRGMDAPAAAKRFLRPKLDTLHDPALLADGQAAAARITAAIRSGERIFVHGDYDVDGICATALLTRWFRELGGDVVPFVPHRLRDGYDFGPTGLAAARDAGADLIVTADCGTVAHDTVAAADGVDVIITDHHTVAGSLPSALAVVNPQRPDCAYPFKDLCGTGVAYKLCELVAHEAGADPAPLAALLDLVALATVADLVPLRDENRTLVHHGLRLFERTRVRGIEALIGVAGVDPSGVTAGRLGFTIAPRINAAGRVGDSADALALLLSEDHSESRTLASQLEETNRRRQEEDQRTLSEALDMLEREYQPERDFGVVLAAEGWHPGVIGIVASRIVERIHRPVVLLAINGDQARGSARSIPGFNLYEALAACSEHMLRFGGHEQAAGMDVARDLIDAFRNCFNAAARDRLEGHHPRPSLRVDAEIDLAMIDVQLVHWLSYLGPHGIGNPGPAFVAKAVAFEQAKVVGKGHVKATLRDGGAALGAIGFGLAEAHPPETLMRGLHDVAFKLERNEWRGRVSPQARLTSIRPAEAPHA